MSAANWKPFTWTFDSPNGRTFTVEARTEEEARRKIMDEHRDGRLLALRLVAPWEMLSSTDQLRRTR